MNRAASTRLASALTLLCLAPPAHATRTPDYLQGHPEVAIADGDPVRAQRSVAGHPIGDRGAWDAFRAEEGGQWSGMWDRHTGVPLRVWGSGIAAPGAVASAVEAERVARELLEKHRALFAPGSEPGDFQVVGNQLHDGVRSVGFRQHHRGLPVLQGQFSVRIKRDRVIAFGSEAWPHVDLEPTFLTVDPDLARYVAADWIEGELGVRGVATQVSSPRILVLARDGDGGSTQHEVVTVTVEGRSHIGRWDVHLDAETGDPVAHRQTIRFGTASVLFNVPERRPGSTRLDYVAPMADIFVDGVSDETDANGDFTWSGTGPVSVDIESDGSDIDMENTAGSELLVDFGSVSDTDVLVVDRSSDELEDAQVSAFVHTTLVRDWVSARSGISWATSRTRVETNISDVCNAYYDGSSINFFESGGGCENTGRLADVVYHEFGHGTHDYNIIPGVGFFDGALGEGVADYQAVTMTGDSAMAVGFFQSASPLRELNPVGVEYRWPDDVSPTEIHLTGLIIGSTLWDLREQLQATLGSGPGVDQTDDIWFGILQRAVDIPSTFTEALVEDDDDGDLANGTPNYCDILSVFAEHGLATGASGDVGVQLPVHAGRTISVDVLNPAGCVDLIPTGADLEWRLKSDPYVGGVIPMTQSGDTWTADLPTQAAGEVTEYQVRVHLPSTTAERPINPADRWYQYFHGGTTEIYCTDFETDPALDGWTHTGPTDLGADDWQWGSPSGSSDGTDPELSWSGSLVYGNDLAMYSNWNGMYQDNILNSTTSQVIDVTGAGDVRLLFRRWLAVEDGFYDRARIYVNGTIAWENAASPSGTSADVHHVDHEWRFVELDLNPFVVSDQVELTFEIESDAGLHLGGWTLDDLCVVDAAAASTGTGTTGTGTTGTGTTGTGTSGTGTSGTGTGTGSSGTGTSGTGTGTGTSGTGSSGTGTGTGTSGTGTPGTGTSGTGTGTGTGTGDPVDPSGDQGEDLGKPVLVDGRNGACGCDSGGQAPLGGLALGVLALVRRRRESQGRTCL